MSNRFTAIRDDLRARIARGDLVPGACLPARPALARHYGVALATLERAIAGLLASGELTAVNGRGTFVGDPAHAPMTQPVVPDGARLGIVGEWGPDALVGGDGAWDPLLLAAIEHHASTRGLVSTTVDRWRAGPWQAVGDACAAAVAAGADALIVIGTGHDEAIVDEARRAAGSRPLVYLAGRALDRPLAQATVDNRRTGLLAAEHLLALGPDLIVCCAPYRTRWQDERMEGLAGAVRRALPAPALELGSGEDVTECCSNAIAAGKGVAVFASNDEAALAVADALHVRGFTAGRDYALLGVDDRPEARIAGLSTLRLDSDGLGAAAIRLVLRTLGGDALPALEAVSMLLVRRASTAIHLGSPR